MKYLGAQSGMGFLIIKAWRIQLSCMLFVCNNPIPSVSIRRGNTTVTKLIQIRDADKDGQCHSTDWNILRAICLTVIITALNKINFGWKGFPLILH